MRCRSSRAFAFLSADLGQTVVPTPSIPYGSPSLEGFLSEKPGVTPELHQMWPQNQRKQRKKMVTVLIISNPGHLLTFYYTPQAELL